MSSVRINQFLNTVADAGMEMLRLRLHSAKGRRKPMAELCHELLSTLGEASGTAIARDIVERYQSMDADTKLEFFNSLKNEFDVDRSALAEAAEAYCSVPDDDSLMQLIRQTDSNRQELFRRINTAPGGTHAIVDMRADLLHLVKEHPHLTAVEFDLRHLLTSWFNRGFLVLEQINWDTPATILEKLIENESVHAMQGWSDLRNRLAEDRRCFAFFHPALPSEPLIFVEVALVSGLADSIAHIIDDSRTVSNPNSADTAIFYSINNCLRGLQSISFGNFLLKQVVRDLSQEFPNIKCFSTLSPIPDFRKWLGIVAEHPQKHGISKSDLQVLSTLETSCWFEDSKLCAKLRPLLLRLVAQYFIKAEKRGQPFDSVARFHLRNGATLTRINWLGDCSEKGLQQSAGMLANYVYDPDSIVENHERYVKDGTLAISKKVYELQSKKSRAI